MQSQHQKCSGSPTSSWLPGGKKKEEKEEPSQFPLLLQSGKGLYPTYRGDRKREGGQGDVRIPGSLRECVKEKKRKEKGGRRARCNASAMRRREDARGARPAGQRKGRDRDLFRKRGEKRRAFTSDSPGQPVLLREGKRATVSGIVPGHSSRRKKRKREEKGALLACGGEFGAPCHRERGEKNAGTTEVPRPSRAKGERERLGLCLPRGVRASVPGEPIKKLAS